MRAGRFTDVHTGNIRSPALKEMKQLSTAAKSTAGTGLPTLLIPHTGWVDLDVIGIDLGITMLGAENFEAEKCGDGSCRTPRSAGRCEAFICFDRRAQN